MRKAAKINKHANIITRQTASFNTAQRFEITSLKWGKRVPNKLSTKSKFYEITHGPIIGDGTLDQRYLLPCDESKILTNI